MGGWRSDVLTRGGGESGEGPSSAPPLLLPLSPSLTSPSGGDPRGRLRAAATDAAVGVPWVLGGKGGGNVSEPSDDAGRHGPPPPRAAGCAGGRLPLPLSGGRAEGRASVARTGDGKQGRTMGGGAASGYAAVPHSLARAPGACVAATPWEVSARRALPPPCRKGSEGGKTKKWRRNAFSSFRLSRPRPLSLPPAYAQRHPHPPGRLRRRSPQLLLAPRTSATRRRPEADVSARQVR